MTITSVSFLIFLLISVLIFYIFPVKYRWIVLLAASVCFYVLAGAVNFLPFIVFTSLVIWLCARKIGKLYEELDEKLGNDGLDKHDRKSIREEYKHRAKNYLILALILCIGVLVVTKFGNYLIEFINTSLLSAGENVNSGIGLILVPLGISYYTFSTVGYILDVYWKRYSYETNFARFFLYAIYFPHIVQGPISRYNQLGLELKKELRFNSKRIVSGMELMLWGFFKKMVMADRFGIFVSAVYNGADHEGSIFLVAALFDALWIYTDFSGYMDIVRGVSEIFGIKLESNFNHPFFSETVPEFWRRWHMTLGAWFKDYVYYPCTISGWMKKLDRKTKAVFPERISRLVSVAIPLLITWFLTGLWHGTGTTYICWGIYYGVLLTVSTAFAPAFKKLNEIFKINTDCFSWHLFRKIRTFVCFMGGRFLTSPGNLRYGLLIIKTIFLGFVPARLFDGTLFTLGLDAPNFILSVLCIFILWAVSMMQERFSVREKLQEQNVVFRWIILYSAIFAILILGIYGIGYDAASFIYEQY